MRSFLIIHEGLAESFAGSLFGEDVLGPYFKEFKDAAREKARRLIGKGLQRTAATIEEATFTPAADIVELSGYF